MANVNAIELTAKQVTNGVKGVLALTSQLSQVLRTFADQYDKILPDTEGLTVEAWMSAMGVERLTKTNAVGKVTKKGYTPGTIRKGWNPEMLIEEKMATFRNVVAKYTDADGKEYRVYTPEEAKKLDGKPVTRMELCEIADDKWTVALILRGLKQGRKLEEYQTRVATTASAFAKLKKFCIVKITTDTKGVQKREIIDVKKSDVTF